MKHIAAVVAGLSLAFVGTSATIAGTINVPADQPTIAAAISASVNGDVIAIAAGTYNEHTLNTGGKAITIGSASGNLDVTIDAQQGGSVFVFNSGETSGTEIKDLVITGGSASYGGGISCDSSDPSITDCTIEGNTAAHGGGISCDSSNPIITDCTIEDNTATYGGGISCWNNSNPTITGCWIFSNTASNNSGGGGIFCESSSPTISGCTIESNTADLGGGICCQNGSPTITNCEIVGNTGTLNGGGIICFSDSNPTVSGCTIDSNVPKDCQMDDSSSLTIITSAPASPSGACCVSSGCVALTSDDCTALGGNWLGEGSSCDDCPASCSGDTNNDGVINIEDLLNMLSNFGSVCP